MMMRFHNNEPLLAAVIVGIAVVFGLAAPQFFSLAHLFGIARSSVVLGIMALGMLVVLITGGIDVSVSAVAVCSAYIATLTLIAFGYHGSFLVAVLLALCIGGLLGAVNAVLVTLLKLPSLIVTLGTLTLYHGGLLAFLGTRRIRRLPAHMNDFFHADLITVTSMGRQAHLHVAVGVFVALAIALAWAMRATRWGRSLYAVGDNEEAARRMGVPVVRTRFVAFVLAGALSGLAGIFSAALNQAADPFTIVGSELEVLAAVVLGGAAITGGRGSVLGTVLGVLLITMVGSSLVMVGIPTAWRESFVGLLLLLGLGVPALQRRRADRRHGRVMSD